ncbi:hypothetical protein ABKV19_005330 [Rosa sericea]
MMLISCFVGCRVSGLCLALWPFCCGRSITRVRTTSIVEDCDYLVKYFRWNTCRLAGRTCREEGLCILLSEQWLLNLLY